MNYVTYLVRSLRLSRLSCFGATIKIDWRGRERVKLRSTYLVLSIISYITLHSNKKEKVLTYWT